MRSFAASAVALAILAGPIAARPSSVPTIATAVAASGRSADNVKLDEGRRPAQVLRFLGLRPGMQVLDLFGGNRYWAEIMAPAVGSKGSVTVWEPKQFFKPDAEAAFDAFIAKTPNVSIVSTPFEAPTLPKNRFDFVILNDNYHDTYWQSDKYGIPKMDPAAFLKVVHDSMKPGGVIGVVDHVANPNAETRATVDKLHRIDPNVVKADFKRAGFVLVGSSDILRNTTDDHSILSTDARIRGHTDRFIFKFKKPA
ncbi:methyltransferase [Sphingomonas sp.]|uniref:class I SAM-dependent methyltransferase n=1 Tax=Sphingomonas sp. TaxID=28214 RepID=UPI0025E1BC28|nr:methyltransferase [Sphingomonas sp.]MBV9527399.1 class I SAM-dependent methyltransferase [Sphingomonas sp.]